MERPEWCRVGAHFNWKASHITGCKSVEEKKLLGTPTMASYIRHVIVLYMRPFMTNLMMVN